MSHKVLSPVHPTAYLSSNGIRLRQKVVRVYEDVIVKVALMF